MIIHRKPDGFDPDLYAPYGEPVSSRETMNRIGRRAYGAPCARPGPGVRRSLAGFFGITGSSCRVGGSLLILFLPISMMHARIGPVRRTKEKV